MAVDRTEPPPASSRWWFSQRLVITRIPILIGAGIPLFGPLQQDIRLRHVETQSYPSGLVQSEYEVIA